MQRPFLFSQGFARLGMDADNKKAKVSAPKDKKNAPAGESGNQRPKRRKEKLIRLDDLIPKQDVTGGDQITIWATHTGTTPKPKNTNGKGNTKTKKKKNKKKGLQ